MIYRLKPLTFDGIPERIQAKLIVSPSGCWLWQGSTANNGGYGRVKFRGKPQYVHRVVWLLVRGKSLKGWELDHLCRTRACCNPRHLEPVSRSTNITRSNWRRPGHF